MRWQKQFRVGAQEPHSMCMKCDLPISKPGGPWRWPHVGACGVEKEPRLGPGR